MYSYDAGTTTPTLSGLCEVGGIRINDGTFKSENLGPLESTPPVYVPTTDLASSYGASVGTQLYRSWPFTLNGWIYVPSSPYDVPPAKDQLQNAVAVQGLQTLTFNAPGWSAERQLSAMINGPIMFSPRHGRRLVPTMNFTIPMLAPDPRMYATSTTTATITLGGSGTPTSVTNNGSVSTPFTVRFTGPMTGGQLVLNATGNPQIYLGSGVTIGTGQWIEISTNPSAAGGVTAVWQDGTNAFPSITGGWSVYSIPPGTSSWFVNSSGTGAGSGVTMTYQDAWA